MNLFLKRLHSGNNSTIGALYINSVFQCFTCEDEPRKIKIPGRTKLALMLAAILVLAGCSVCVSTVDVVTVKDVNIRNH